MEFAPLPDPHTGEMSVASIVQRPPTVVGQAKCQNVELLIRNLKNMLGLLESHILRRYHSKKMVEKKLLTWVLMVVDEPAEWSAKSRPLRSIAGDDHSSSLSLLLSTCSQCSSSPACNRRLTSSWCAWAVVAITADATAQTLQVIWESRRRRREAEGVLIEIPRVDSSISLFFQRSQLSPTTYYVDHWPLIFTGIMVEGTLLCLWLEEESSSLSSLDAILLQKSHTRHAKWPSSNFGARATFSRDPWKRFSTIQVYVQSIYSRARLVKYMQSLSDP